MKMTTIKNLKQVQLPNHAHTGVFGVTGSGKSHLANIFSNFQKRNIIYKVNVGKDSSWINANTWDIKDIAENDQMEYIMKNDEMYPIYISDSGENYAENLEYMWAFLLENNLSAIILMDEIHNYQNAAERFISEGRKHQITVIYTSTKPEHIKNTTITANTPLFIMFALTHKMEKGLRENYGILFPQEQPVIEHNIKIKRSPIITYINDYKSGIVPQYKYHSVIYNYRDWIFLDADYNVINVL